MCAEGFISTHQSLRRDSNKKTRQWQATCEGLAVRVSTSKVLPRVKASLPFSHLQRMHLSLSMIQLCMGLLRCELRVFSTLVLAILLLGERDATPHLIKTCPSPSPASLTPDSKQCSLLFQ